MWNLSASGDVSHCPLMFLGRFLQSWDDEATGSCVMGSCAARGEGLCEQQSQSDQRPGAQGPSTTSDQTLSPKINATILW